MYRGGGLRLSASVAPGVSGSEWYWPVVGSAYSGVSQCGCASPGEWTDELMCCELIGGGGGRDSDGLVTLQTSEIYLRSPKSRDGQPNLKSAASDSLRQGILDTSLGMANLSLKK